MEEHDILIGEDGAVEFIYADDVAAVFAGEPQETRRASHVEPHPFGGGWLADMRPSNGPVLGANGSFDITHAVFEDPLLLRARDIEPFPTRQEALDAEMAWLRAKMEGR